MDESVVLTPHSRRAQLREGSFLQSRYLTTWALPRTVAHCRATEKPRFLVRVSDTMRNADSLLPGVTNTAGEMPASVGTVYWSLANNQGSVTDVVNSSGTVENHTAYDPFGNVISGLSSASVDFLFGQYGEFADSATGQVFAQNRVYDPAIDRWDRPDPTGLLFGPNPYKYCDNDPTNYFDPSGLAGNVNVANTTSMLNRDPAAAALLADATNNGVTIQVGNTQFGAQFQNNTITLDPNKLNGTTDTVPALLFELLRWKYSKAQAALDARARAGTITKPVFADECSKITYAIENEHHAIASNAIANRKWLPLLDRFKADLAQQNTWPKFKVAEQQSGHYQTGEQRFNVLQGGH